MRSQIVMGLSTRCLLDGQKPRGFSGLPLRGYSTGRAANQGRRTTRRHRSAFWIRRLTYLLRMWHRELRISHRKYLPLTYKARHIRLINTQNWTGRLAQPPITATYRSNSEPWCHSTEGWLCLHYIRNRLQATLRCPLWFIHDECQESSWPESARRKLTGCLRRVSESTSMFRFARSSVWPRECL